MTEGLKNKYILINDRYIYMTGAREAGMMFIIKLVGKTNTAHRQRNERCFGDMLLRVICFGSH